MITLLRNKIHGFLAKYKPYAEIKKELKNRNYRFSVYGIHGSFLNFFVSDLKQYHGKPFLLVFPNEKEAESAYNDLAAMDESISYFPWWGTAPYKGLHANAGVYGRRIDTLAQLSAGYNGIVITSLRGLLSPLPSPETLSAKTLKIQQGMSFDPIEMERILVEYGYNRVPRVTVRKEFALRGEVLDIYLPGQELATRIVFEFDEIESIKMFDSVTQSSVKSIEKSIIYPAREVIWDEPQKHRLKEYFSGFDNHQNWIKAFLEKIETRGEADGEEIFYPAALSETDSIMSYLPEYASVLFIAPERLKHQYETLKTEYMRSYRAARQTMPAPDPDKLLLPFYNLEKRAHRRLDIREIRSVKEESKSYTLQTEPGRSFFGNVPYMKEELGTLQDSGYSIYVFSESEAQASRISYLLQDFSVTVSPERLSSGFVFPDAEIIVIEEAELFGRRKRVAASVKKAKSKAIESFIELNPGDHVVHINYGIGKFHGIERIKALGQERDYISLEYSGEEMIYVPIEQVNMVQRYIGSGENPPRLDKIGGKSWEKRKGHVKKSVEDLAERLIALYSKRKKAQGFAFAEESDWQVSFEAAFPYDETEDQLKCISDIKEDMESPQPMDRLICGDVGYGKTEVSMRAAFKAVMAGKQVAYLGPTTILVEQHFENFQERFKDFPVRIQMLSRFVKKKQATQALEALAKGEVDIIIGTHRLLSKDVKFKDLGLIIVDEEQRFGVKDKERLKELKHSVDSISLSATPIPRTLHMSLLKIRDMSVLETPPSNRRPIETYIEEFDEQIIREAVIREVERGGQVYYLHNRIETLDDVGRFLEKIFPELMIETAHGRMPASKLEDKMHRFIHGGFHVLVATTIIENGIDIPNVNTIIIDRADMYGISQLYQLRGRVGRSERLAYAYLLYPQEKALSEIAMKRLRVISDHTELGSGFKVALKDLEVRGAGNLLGREQHGDILSVGFDMYIKLLDEAVKDLTKEQPEGPEEVYLELDYSGFIPDSFISDATEKMEFYKKIASISTEEESERIIGELEDKFGPLPQELQSLIALSEIRVFCRKLWITSLKERGGKVNIEFGKVSHISADKVMRLIQESGGKVKLDPAKPNQLKIETGLIGLKEKSEFIREKLSTLL
ncbi:MAG: transcription-repair coupling factor [Spirochaetia bacterium]